VRQRDLRIGELTERAGIGIARRQLGPERFAHAIVDDHISVIAAEQLEHGDLVVLVGIEAKIAAMMPIREDVLIQLRDVERLR